FEWYNGTVTSGSPDFTGAIYTKLAMGIYTVEVTDKITQCRNQMQGEITDGRFLPPTPSPEIINHQTSCIGLNGEIQVTVDGETFGFQFDWYLGTGISATPDLTGANLQNLDIGSYTVTATDIETGCVSEPVTVEILDKRVDPEFVLNIINAPCETSEGSVEVEFLATIPIDKIIWTDPTTGQQITEGSGLYDFPAGDYQVTITSAEGCSVTTTAQIGTEIISYNGMSPNGDQSNDGFEIACITLFPNNNVKIFNRAGTLVYEADGYNNNDIIFTGVGENGIYMIGIDVPDGTYFYVIDKRDGSRPEKGFLELLR
ncbi:MAG: gliding motility-associated C-terminal domain-containing protein, partial [Bacteroidetes bacterium]|nr:gliding motility-associated C-terminal domain-containing protein [Bacteroidota bacterium]